LFLLSRFGEESLHACEVMLKDVEDSKRANNAVHSELARGRAQAPTPASRQQPVST
jgi:anaphase-promoting complex subunit 2